MFNKIKEFFTGSKPAVDATQEAVLTPVDVAIKNIKETTAAVDAKVEPVAESKPAPAKEQAWTKKPAPSIAKSTKPKQQSAKAVTAPKKKPPAPK
jgi:hypothetical protein